MSKASKANKRRLDRGDLIWLVYVIFYFIEPISRPSLVFWLQSIGAAMVFIALYIGFFWFRDFRTRLLVLIAILLLGVITFPSNGGAITFFIYAAALLPFLVQTIWVVMAAVLLGSVLLAADGLWLHRSPYNWGFGIFWMLFVACANIVTAQRIRADCKLRMAQEEIEALAAVAERERIARDLHDVLGHTLSVIVLKAELAGRLLAGGEEIGRAAAEIGDVERTARSALAEVRETIGGYRARGLPAEMEAARNALSAAGVELHVEGAPTPAKLHPAEETVLALALREAVTNVVRHAQAHTCTLRFAMENGRHSLVIEDDGMHAATREGNGLRGMRERVESMGGRLLLEREHGTRLSIELPATGGAS